MIGRIVKGFKWIAVSLNWVIFQLSSMKNLPRKVKSEIYLLTKSLRLRYSRIHGPVFSGIYQATATAFY